jgi:hypothetical protein
MLFNGFHLMLCLLSFIGGYGYHSVVANLRWDKHLQWRAKVDHAANERTRLLRASDTPIHDQLRDEWDF